MRQQNNTPLSKTFQLLFLFLVVTGVYYYVIHAERLSVDDTFLINSLINKSQIDIKSIFFPKKIGTYYRPLLYLTYIIDGKIWQANESFMHLENLLLHTISVFIVFYLAEELIAFFNIKAHPYFPFFSALLFSVHPITTESVAWISGRTDLLAGLFVVLSLYVLIKKGIYNYFWTFIAGLLYLGGLLSKEVAIGLMPLIFLLCLHLYKQNYPHFRLILFISGIYFIMTITYFFMRSGFIISQDPGLSNVISTTTNIQSLWPNLRGFLKATGFYFKKLFVPIPLNFAITEISTAIYLPLGIIITVLTLIALLKRLTFYSFCFLYMVIFYLPATILPIAKITWTPLAERYIYISSMGASMMIIILLQRPKKETIKILLPAVLIFIAGIITYNRIQVWRSNLTLFADTVNKNPNFAPARNEYAIALLNAGKLEEAIKQIKIAKKLAAGTKYYVFPQINEIIIRSDLSKKEKIDFLLKILSQKKLHPRFKKMILEKIVFWAEISDNGRNKVPLLIRLYKELFKINPQGFYLYKLGQLYLKEGQKRKALESFKKALQNSTNEFFSLAAQKLIKKLESEMSNTSAKNKS